LNKVAYIFFYLIAFGFVAKAQGPVMSQPYSVNQYLSPAAVGNGDYTQRVQGNLKSQSIGGASAYKTIIAGWDTRFKNSDEEQKNYFGVGVQVMSDQMMAGILQNNYITLNLAYHLYLDKNFNNELSMGLGGIYAQSSLDKTQLRFSDGYSLSGNYNPGYDDINNIKSNPANFSATTGILYTHHTNDAFFQLGATLSFLSPPSLTNYNYDTSTSRKASLFLNVEKSFSEDYTFLIHGSFENKNGLSQYVAGGAIGIPIFYKYEQARRLYIGCFDRVGDVISPTVSMMMEKYTLGFSYDIYNSGFSGANIKPSSFEISLSTSFGKKRNELFRSLFD
jgi:type IX secretion system PorP/SprF family membrane protein